MPLLLEPQVTGSPASSAAAPASHGAPQARAHVRTVRLRHGRVERAAEEVLRMPPGHILLQTVLSGRTPVALHCCAQWCHTLGAGVNCAAATSGTSQKEHFVVGVLTLCSWLVQMPASSLVRAPGSLQAGAAAPVVAPPQRQQLPAAAVLGGSGGSGRRGDPPDAGQSPPVSCVTVV